MHLEFSSKFRIAVHEKTAFYHILISWFKTNRICFSCYSETSEQRTRKILHKSVRYMAVKVWVSILKSFVILSFLFLLTCCVQGNGPRKEVLVSMEETCTPPPLVSQVPYLVCSWNLQYPLGYDDDWWGIYLFRDCCIICRLETVLLMSSSKTKNDVIKKLLLSRNYFFSSRNYFRES